MEARFPNAKYISPGSEVSELNITLSSEDKREIEFAAFDKGKFNIFLSYHIVSTIPESGVSKICNRIKKFVFENPEKISSVTICISRECPRESLRKIEETRLAIGLKDVFFEFLEAKAFRLNIEKEFGVKCLSFETEHTRRVVSRLMPNTSIGIKTLKDENDKSVKLGKLFVCHASEDKAFVTKLVKVLDKYSDHVWYDTREVLVGDSITRKVGEGLTDADYLIIVLSNISVTKPWVSRELGYALNKDLSDNDFTIIPVVIDDCEVPALIKDIRYADFREGFTCGINQVIGSIQKMRLQNA